MPWWIYKCNSRQQSHQVEYGDWDDFFEVDAGATGWGSTESVPALAKLSRGDGIFAYQTDRNELVGLAEVTKLRKRGTHTDIFLRPLTTLRIKVRPLKKADPKIGAIPALRPGPIMTIYEISDDDARRLLEAAGTTDPLHKDERPRAADTTGEEFFLEGERRAAMGTVRNPRLRRAAKRKWGLTCHCCGFDFGLFYGRVGEGCAIVHHLHVFGRREVAARKTTLDEVRVICANCHYILHLTDPPMSVEALKADLADRWDRWTEDGLTRKGRNRRLR